MARAVSQATAARSPAVSPISDTSVYEHRPGRVPSMNRAFTKGVSWLPCSAAIRQASAAVTTPAWDLSTSQKTSVKVGQNRATLLMSNGCSSTSTCGTRCARASRCGASGVDGERRKMCPEGPDAWTCFVDGAGRDRALARLGGTLLASKLRDRWPFRRDVILEQRRGDDRNPGLP